MEQNTESRTDPQHGQSTSTEVQRQVFQRMVLELFTCRKLNVILNLTSHRKMYSKCIIDLTIKLLGENLFDLGFSKDFSVKLPKA
jgi:hypothetical protein